MLDFWGMINSVIGLLFMASSWDYSKPCTAILQDSQLYCLAFINFVNHSMCKLVTDILISINTLDLQLLCLTSMLISTKPLIVWASMAT